MSDARLEEIDEQNLEAEPDVEWEFPEPEEEPEAEEEEEEEAEEPEAEEELAQELISIATERAMAELFSIQDRLEAAEDDHADKAEAAKSSKKRVEHLQEDLSAATRRSPREARSKSEPDPARYPLLDSPKAEINATFAKPEAIPPLDPEDFPEAYRRRARDTKLSDIGLPARTVKALEKAGLVMVGDIGKLTEASAPLTSVGGIGEKAAEQIIEALDVFAHTCKLRWDADHPEAEE